MPGLCRSRTLDIKSNLTHAQRNELAGLVRVLVGLWLDKES